MSFKDDLQRHYLVDVVGGTFGTGRGAELALDASSPSGSYSPVLIPVADLERYPVRPCAVAQLITASATRGWPEPCLLIIEDG